MSGWVQDTVDIKVYERSQQGLAAIISRNYRGDGVNKTFEIGTSPVTETALFVKINGTIQKLTTDYTIDYSLKTITFVTVCR